MKVWLAVDFKYPSMTTVCDSVRVAEWHKKEMEKHGSSIVIIPRWVRTKEDCDDECSENPE